MKKNTGEPHLRFAVLAVDVALMTVRHGKLLIRLTPVHRPPHFPNSTGLPGGLIDPKETAEEAAHRIIQTKGHIESPVYMEQLYTFSEPNRDPRGRVVAVGYIALIPWDTLSTREQEDTDTAWWAPIEEARDLAYDHDLIRKTAHNRLRARTTYSTIVSKLMPHEFTLTDLELVYESILKTGLDKRNFRKKILKIQILTALNKKRTGGAFRPAELYRFTSPSVKEIEIL